VLAQDPGDRLRLGMPVTVRLALDSGGSNAGTRP
jgi:HlyD family secretion protein